MSYPSIIANKTYSSDNDKLSFKCIGDWIIQDFTDSRVAINKVNKNNSTDIFKPGNKPDSCNSDGFTSNILKPINSDCSINYLSNCYIHQINNTIENFDQNISNKIVEHADAEPETTTSNKIIEHADAVPETITSNKIIEHADAVAATTTSARASAAPAVSLPPNPTNTSNSGWIITGFLTIGIVGPIVCFLYSVYSQPYTYRNRFSIGE